MRAVVLFILVLSLAGCGRVGSSPSGPEQGVIVAYARAAEAVEGTRAKVVRGWAELARAPTLEVFRGILRRELLPALRTYRDALKGIRVTMVDELGLVHAGLVQTYDTLIEELGALLRALGSESPERLQERLQEILRRTRAAERRYRASIAMIYKTHGVVLKPGAGASTAPSPAEGAGGAAPEPEGR